MQELRQWPLLQPLACVGFPTYIFRKLNLFNDIEWWKILDDLKNWMEVTLGHEKQEVIFINHGRRGEIRVN